jgi:hypothetical protein
MMRRTASDPRPPGDFVASDRDAQHEHRDDHRERVFGGAERQRAHPDHHRLEHHHREADEQRDDAVDREELRAQRCGFVHVERDHLAPSRPQHREDGPDRDVHPPHHVQDPVEPEPVHEDEPGRERARECADGVRCVDQRMHAGRVFEVAGERLREDRDRPSHQGGGRDDQQRGEHHVECEPGDSLTRGPVERSAARNREQQRE